MLEDFSPKWTIENPHPPVYGEDVEVAEPIRQVLGARGIKKLYSHQSEAIKAVREGKNIVLMAPTASGKTECYMIPVVEAALNGKCSLLLFPTKALSRDQWNRIREFNMLGVRSAVYDGDTPQSQRTKIRNDMPHVIITNVDMLHFMLNHNKLWAKFFSKLKYVVVDEIHAYSGTLGSHVANLMWRLKRVVKKTKKAGAKKLEKDMVLDLNEREGAGVISNNENIQFIVSSATIGNAHEFASKICGEFDFELIEGKGAPRGKIHHAVVSESDQSVVTACLKIAKEMKKKTLIFANSHNMAERLGNVGKRAGIDVAVYRSGLPPDERRELEAGFHSGRVKVMAATSALELGMDVGDAELAILAGFPGTVTRFKQRVGRVGRKGQDAYAVLVARQGPLDQYYAANPSTYLEGKAESCYAKMNNEYIRRLHLLSASKDRALSGDELDEDDLKICKKLVSDGLMKSFADSYFPTKEGYGVVMKLSMRNAGKRIRIIDEGSNKQIGEREMSVGIGELYEGAVYLLGGKRYESLGIDLNEETAKVKRIEDEGEYYTQALKTKNAQILDIEKDDWWGEIALGRGKVHITDTVHGYVVKDVYSGRTVSRHELDMPLSYEFDTHAMWADWDEWADGRAEFASGLHALEHVSIAMMPALSGADPAEIGGISYPTGRIFYYEGSEGGSGLAEIIMPRYGECVEMAKERLEKCKCESGCPSCIFSPQCGNNNYFLDKKEALELAKVGIEKAKKENKIKK